MSPLGEDLAFGFHVEAFGEEFNDYTEDTDDE